MFAYTIKRIGLTLVVALTVSFISFLTLHLSGDLAQAMAGADAKAADVERIRQQYGLDRPLLVQYASWADKALTGDFGESFYFRKPVTELLADRFPVTIALALSAIIFALGLAIPLGVAAAARPNSWIDRLCLSVSVVGQALPSFWFSLMLIIFFGVTLRWLPVSGSGSWQHYVMPAIALGYYATPALMRLTRAGMLEALDSDYIRTARAKGLRTHSIIFKHALRNAAIPIVAVSAVQFGFMLSGSVVIETVFAIRGIGHFAWEAISRSDFPVVQAIVLILAFVYVGLNLIADLLIAALDPRLRMQGEGV